MGDYLDQFRPMPEFEMFRPFDGPDRLVGMPAHVVDKLERCGSDPGLRWARQFMYEDLVERGFTDEQASAVSGHSSAGEPPPWVEGLAGDPGGGSAGEPVGGNGPRASRKDPLAGDLNASGEPDASLVWVESEPNGFVTYDEVAEQYVGLNGGEPEWTALYMVEDPHLFGPDDFEAGL